MSVAISFRALCLSQSAIADLIGERLHQARAIDGLTERFPFAVFFRRGHQHLEELDPPLGEEPFQVSFDLECVSLDLGESQDLAAAFRGLHNYSGVMGSGAVQGIFIEDQDDDYQPRIAAEDGAVHVAALQIEIFGYEEGEG